MTRRVGVDRITLLAIAVGLALPITAAAQFGSVAGVMLGYIADSGDARLRPVQGIIGSATIGTPVTLDPAVTRTFAIDGHAFLMSTDTGLSAVSLDANATHTVPIERAEPNPTHVAASVHASSAALYYEDRQQILIVTGLPAKPTVSHVIDLPPSLPRVTRVAIDEAGTLLIFAVSDGTTDVIQAWTPEQPFPRAVATARAVTAIVIASSGDALITDGAANEAFWIRNPREGAYQQYLAGEAAGLASPVGALLMSDGGVFVANAGSSQIVRLDAAGGMLGTLSCGCVPAGIFAFSGATYRLTDRTDQTVYLLDVSDSRGRIVFVPRIESR